MPEQSEVATECFDVIVVGGGIVGATAACALADGEHRVVVIEASEPDSWMQQPDVDMRVFAVSRASQQIFSALGVWDAMVAGGVSPFRSMEVWDAGGSGCIRFDCADLGEDCLGHIVENRVMLSALHERMGAEPAVSVLCPERMTGIDVRASSHVTVRLESGRQLQARLVIGADGAASRVRQAACIRAHEHDYHQCAIVAVVKTEYPHRETAWQRFLPTGPLAFLPLRDGLSSIVWSTTTTESERLMALEAEDFHAELAASFGYRLGRIQRSGPRAVFALRRLHAEQYVRPRLALIGDAAHMIHPLAGQGVNLGILDAAVLAEVVTDARRSGRDAGSLPVLRRYERWRRGENLIMMTAMDGFNLAFASSLMPVREVRNLGLRLADAMAPLKQLFMKHAMGLSGDLPRLARRA